MMTTLIGSSEMSLRTFRGFCKSKGDNVGWFSGQFFRIFEIIIFCFVAIFDLVHNVEAIFHLPYISC